MIKTETTTKPRANRMRSLLRKALIALVGLGLAAILIVSGVYWRWTRSSLPQLAGEMRLAGLTGNATIERDHWGTPYITAANLDDLAFAQGYALAQDRLWQMDLMRRAAKGELSAVLGAGENNAQLDFDKQQRNLGLKRGAERSFQRLSPQMRALLEAYARGVNAYISSHQNSLPMEFHLLGYQPAPWQAVDSLLMGKLMAESLTSNWKFDLMRADLAKKLKPEVYKMLFDERTAYDQPIVGEDLPTVENNATARIAPDIPPIDKELIEVVRSQTEVLPDIFLSNNAAMLGSNNWVISGKRSATGKPLLANDPHQGLSLPAIWYQVNLRVSDGSYHAAGVSIIGAPGIVIGHNDNIAWGATNLMADVQDLYVEEFDPNNPHRYRVGNEWRDAEVIKEQIEVRQSMLSSATKSIEHEVIITRHGPIIASSDGQKLALKWSGSDDDDAFTSTFQINTARNWDEFCAALRNYSAPVINYVYADVNGNIGYYGAGHIPIRATGDGSMPYDGRGNDNEWQGYIPFEEMPHLYNPPNGWIDTANQRIAGSSYRYHLANDWAPPYRAYRINSLLAQKDHVTLADINEIQGDVYAVPTYIFAQEAIKSAANHGNDARWQELKTELNGWDGKLTAESRAGAIANQMRNEFMDKFLSYWLGDARSTYEWYRRSGVIDRAITMRPAEWLPKNYQSYDDLLIDSYQAAIDKLSAQQGKDRAHWHYGASNQLIFAHPLAKSSLLKWMFNASMVEAGGSAHTINAINTNTDRVWGPSMRMVVSLADFDASTQSIVPGESGQMASQFYTDQVSDWLNLQAHVFPYSEKAIAPIIVNRLKLSPAN